MSVYLKSPCHDHDSCATPLLVARYLYVPVPFWIKNSIQSSCRHGIFAPSNAAVAVVAFVRPPFSLKSRRDELRAQRNSLFISRY